MTELVDKKGFDAPLVGTRGSSDIVSGAFSALLLVSVFLALAAIVSANPNPNTSDFIGAIGVIAAWRYSWWLTHVIRAFVYLKIRFPKIRAKAEAASGEGGFEQLYIVIMSYRIPEETFRDVYDSLIKNVIRAGVPTTIIASVTSRADRAMLRQVFDQNGAPQNLEIVTQYQDGTGKRAAMGEALRIVSRRTPSENTAVLLMDGDIILEESALSQSLNILSADEKLGALTTNNDAIVEGDYVTRNWFFLRYAQRHILMASMAMSNRLLVLTGRFSMFRASIAADPGFIDAVENDGIHHWRHGWLPFVSGDDKSTWHFAMKQGARMLYVPDVKVFGVEALPDGDGFLVGSTRLLQRWFGNMLRSNRRALSLGPRKTGLFVWWSLLDQRVSMWTSMVGPAATLWFSILVSPVFIAYYLLWVLTTRIVMSVVAGIAYGRYSPVWPFVMYFNQIWGAVLKIHLGFRLNKQGWTRQKTGQSTVSNVLDKWVARTMQLATVACFLYLVGLLTSQFQVVGWQNFDFASAAEIK